MHAADFVIFAFAFIAGGGASALIYRGAQHTGWLRLALASFGGVTTLLTFLEIATVWLAQTGDPWNNARLTPAIALHYGFRLYNPLNEGPVLSTVVGPVAFLAYWPIGFLRGSPTTLILAASALNLIACGTLVAALVRRLTQNTAARVILWLVAVQLVLNYDSLRYSLFCIHSDAPALLLGGLGAGLVIFCRDEMDWTRCGAVALCLTLAVWAKQSLAPIFVAVTVVSLLHHGMRGTVRLITASAIVGGVVSAGFVGWLGFANLRDNMFVVPARHPWHQMNLVTGEVYRGLEVVGTVARIKVLVAAALHIIRESWWMFAVLLAALTESLLNSRPGRRWPRRAWAAWLVIAVGLFPTATIGRTKIGGEVNHESFVVLFLIAGFVCWFASIAQEHGRPLPARLAAALAVLMIINAPRALEYPGWSAAWDNQNEAAYRYDLRHPGAVYFPWNPLTSLLAEGKLYHFDYGVFDRNLGGARVSPEQITQHLPALRPPIASFIAHHDYVLRTYFPDYVSRPANPELSDWKIYGPPAVLTPP